MAATIDLVCCTSTDAGTENSISDIMFRSNDSHLTDKNNPITIPASGTNYSYEKWLRWECTAAPDTQCTNFEFWGPDSTPGTGLTIYAGTTDTGVTPTDSDSSVATTQQDTNYYDSSNTLSISGTLTSVGNKTDYLVLQLDVADTASQGDMSTQTMNYAYDEN